jgi:hypothetical protein
MSKIVAWHSDTWNSETATALLTNLQKNKGQTNESREHAALILSWMNLRQSIGSTAISSARSSTGVPAFDAVDSNPMLLSPRNSIQIESDPMKSGIYNNGQSAHLLPLLLSVNVPLPDVFFSFSITGHSKTGARHEYGTTEI